MHAILCALLPKPGVMICCSHLLFNLNANALSYVTIVQLKIDLPTYVITICSFLYVLLSTIPGIY